MIDDLDDLDTLEPVLGPSPMVDAFLAETHHIRHVGSWTILETRPRIECADGFTFSVQASEHHYSTPRADHGPYTHAEIGFPSQIEPTILRYAEDPTKPCDTVYGWVPVDVIEAILESHGGIVALVHPEEGRHLYEPFVGRLIDVPPAARARMLPPHESDPASNPE
jgi:hypothetical protein